MSTNYDLDSLFHPKVDLGNEPTKNSIEYNPSADKGVNGVYKSVIRFVAWWEEPQHSIFEKWVCWLVDPLTTRGRYVDCPSSVGKPSILQDMFFKFYKSESVQERNKASIFSRRHSFASIVQVIKDEQNKDLQGKLMVWKYGKTIWDKIQAQKKPVYGEEHEPFDLLDGKAFAVVVTKVKGFNNYDQSQFLEQKIPLYMPDGKGKFIPINAKTPKESVFNFLKESSPDLNKYAFKEWDQETHDYVNQIIVAVTGETPSISYADVRNNKTSSSSSTPVGTSKSGITASDLTIDDLNTDSNIIGSIPELELPELNSSSDFGIGGDLDEALNNI